MIEIRCLKDIANATCKGSIGEELAEKLREDLNVIKDSCDEDDEYDIESFHTDYTGNGYIVILDGTESKKEIVNLGLSGGLEETVPEAVTNYNLNDTKWTKAIIIYNDSYAMIFWLKNYDGFDSWEMADENIHANAPF